jgi:tRNA1(Val) A37 N6-methylase TrmN6
MVRPQEELLQRRDELAMAFSEEITLDSLTRDFSIYQRRRGHRHSTDDLLTAWYAVTHAVGRPRRLLDLGSGIGSVGLSVLWRFPESVLTAVEVQEVSFALLRENVRANSLEERVTAIHGDLRIGGFSEQFDLVTGSPPYFDVKDGIVSGDSQRAAARFELHGDVTDYCAAAARALAPGGRFVFCFPTPQSQRAKNACAGAGLRLLSFRDVVPKASLAPLFSLFACARMEDAPPAPAVVEPALLVRDAAGERTPEMESARATFGF